MTFKAWFIFAFILQFTNPEIGPIWLQILLLGSIFLLNGLFFVMSLAAASGYFFDVNATVAPKENVRIGSIYGRALAIATINAKSLACYLAAFTQFVQPDIPIWDQMFYILPTALCITAISYTGYTSLGAALGKTAMPVF